MENLAEVTKLIEVLIWPLVVFVAMVLFKDVIREVFGRIKKVNGFGVEAAFDDAIEESATDVIEKAKKVAENINEPAKVQQELVLDYEHASKKLAFLVQKRNFLAAQLQSTGLTPGRAAILRDFIDFHGAEKISKLDSHGLMAEWAALIGQMRAAGRINDGGMVGLSSVGLTDFDDKLTPVGAGIILTFAEEGVRKISPSA